MALLEQLGRTCPSARAAPHGSGAREHFSNFIRNVRRHSIGWSVGKNPRKSLIFNEFLKAGAGLPRRASLRSPVEGLCRRAMQKDYAEALCRRAMQKGYAEGPCRRAMQKRYAEGLCRSAMQQGYAEAPCRRAMQRLPRRASLRSPAEKAGAEMRGYTEGL